VNVIEAGGVRCGGMAARHLLAPPADNKLMSSDASGVARGFMLTAAAPPTDDK